MCIVLQLCTCFVLDAQSIVFVIVNPDSLMCEDQPIPEQDPENPETDPVPEDDGGDDTAVCATNGVTYPSLCRLLQETGNEAVSYAGECDREDCEGGPVSNTHYQICLLYTSPSPRDATLSRMPSSA